MSIINDALKKVQQNLSSNQAKSESIVPSQTSFTTNSTTANQTANKTLELTAKPTLKNYSITMTVISAIVTAWIIITLQMTLSIVNKLNNENKTKQSIDVTAPKNPNLNSPESSKDIKGTIDTNDKVSMMEEETKTTKPSLPSLTNALAVIQTIKFPEKNEKSSAPPAPNFTISGIMEMDGSNAALINDEVYTVGDKIEGLEIKNITLKYIEVSDGINTWQINVKKP